MSFIVTFSYMHVTDSDCTYPSRSTISYFSNPLYLYPVLSLASNYWRAFYFTHSELLCSCLLLYTVFHCVAIL
jgi:hypothetical protein